MVANLMQVPVSLPGLRTYDISNNKKQYIVGGSQVFSNSVTIVIYFLKPQQ